MTKKNCNFSYFFRALCSSCLANQLALFGYINIYLISHRRVETRSRSALIYLFMKVLAPSSIYKVLLLASTFLIQEMFTYICIVVMYHRLGNRKCSKPKPEMGWTPIEEYFFVFSYPNFPPYLMIF